jgi:hypothetical protein
MSRAIHDKDRCKPKDSKGLTKARERGTFAKLSPSAEKTKK